MLEICSQQRSDGVIILTSCGARPTRTSTAVPSVPSLAWLRGRLMFRLHRRQHEELRQYARGAGCNLLLLLLAATCYCWLRLCDGKPFFRTTCSGMLRLLLVAILFFALSLYYSHS